MARRRRRVPGGFVASAVAAGALLALAGHQGASGRTAGASMAVPSGSSYTPQSWAAALLSAGGWPQTACNLGAITAWETAEGGNWENSAAANPLDTTQPESGSWVINSDGVQAYPSWAEGFRATLTTLGYAPYGGIRWPWRRGTALRPSPMPSPAPPWGTGPFNAAC